MKHIILFIIAASLFRGIFAQLEVPLSNSPCKLMTKEKLSYCIDTSYNTIWTGIQIKSRDIEGKKYIPNDKQFFRSMPAKMETLWQKIEIQTRLWAMMFDSVYVTTGVITRVVDSVPKEYYYKALLKGCQGDGLGFWVQADNPPTSIKHCALTIDELEKHTGLNFFHQLDNDLQSIFEAKFGWEYWPVEIE